jgi:hypothetical protein
MSERQPEFILVDYVTVGCSSQFRLDQTSDTIWATQQQIASTFDVTYKTVAEHLQNIWRDGELEEAAVCRKFRVTARDGKNYNTLHYSLDAILTVGYRISGKRATAFRRWATQTLKDYLTKGYALNEPLLGQRPSALRDLAARVRDLRADEHAMYAGVRDIFAESTTDYDKNSEIARKFFAKLQDMFIFAVTGSVSAQVILERADSREPNMGLQAMKGQKPTKTDARIGKNYLDSDELYQLHILAEQFLLFVESRALRGLSLTMEELARKFDELLRVQGHEVFDRYPPYYTRDKANSHADAELAVYKRRLD